LCFFEFIFKLRLFAEKIYISLPQMRVYLEGLNALSFCYLPRKEKSIGTQNNCFVVKSIKKIALTSNISSISHQIICCLFRFFDTIQSLLSHFQYFLPLFYAVI
jgi:hypothetical protein